MSELRLNKVFTTISPTAALAISFGLMETVASGQRFLNRESLVPYGVFQSEAELKKYEQDELYDFIGTTVLDWLVVIWTVFACNYLYVHAKPLSWSLVILPLLVITLLVLMGCSQIINKALKRL